MSTINTLALIGSAGQTKQPRGVVAADVVAHALVQRDAVDEMAGLLARLERIVGREHHALVAERADRARQRIGREHAGGVDDDVAADVIRWPLGELDAVELGAALEPPHQERQRLAEMTEHQRHARKAVEQAAEYEPQRMRAGLERPFP